MQAAFSVSDTARSTNTPTPATAPSTPLERRSATIRTPEKLTPELCRTLICSAPVFRANPSVSLENAGDSQTQGVPCSLRLPDWLKPGDLRIFGLRTWSDCCRMTKAGRFAPSSPRFMTWGTVWNGWCLTAPGLESRNTGGGCSLSDILIPDAPGKYFLSSEQVEKLLYKSSADTRESGSTIRQE